MNKRYPHITTPLRVSGNLMKNRIILAPSTIHSANDAVVKYCDVRDDGEHSNWDTRVHNHKHKLAHLAERIHFHGAKAGMEIIGFLPGIYTCSDGNCIMGSPPIGKEAPKEVLEQTKNDIADCCAALVECGFDGVLSVNVSPLQFKEADFLRKMQDCVTRTGINPQHLEIEITEGILIDNFDEILKKLNFIHDMGIGISLDDFGTGYSSMRYLQLLPLTTLKIDKSFITNISEAGGKETEITESIVSLVSHLGLDAIAEGVETDEQLATLKKFNCKNINVQGFLKGRPMPRDLCDRLVSGDKSAILTIKDSVPENGNG